MKEVTINSCNLCAPLGAAFAFKGVRNCILLLHGSQGCATYIRRYMIAHFREPVDIASSSFSENSTIFGGGEILKTALDNVISQYNPELVGVASTCLSETIGDDVPRFLKEYYKDKNGSLSANIVYVSTPSYCGNHSIGYFKTQRALVETLCLPGDKIKGVNVFIPLLTPGDIRHLKQIFRTYSLPVTLVPDYSDTLDGGAWPEFYQLPPGGTPVESISRCGDMQATMEFSLCTDRCITAGDYLEKEHHVRLFKLPIPIGLNCTDRWIKIMESESGLPTPPSISGNRIRLIDAYTDAHKYVFGKRVVIIGNEDLVYALASFVSEIGMVPVICAGGGTSEKLIPLIMKLAETYGYPVPLMCLDFDYDTLTSLLEQTDADLIIGSSKAYKSSEAHGIPLLRIGFPIHDRFGAASRITIGYLGSRYLLNDIVNTFIEKKQIDNPVGYTYQ